MFIIDNYFLKSNLFTQSHFHLHCDKEYLLFQILHHDCIYVSIECIQGSFDDYYGLSIHQLNINHL